MKEEHFFIIVITVILLVIGIVGYKTYMKDIDTFRLSETEEVDIYSYYDKETIEKEMVEEGRKIRLWKKNNMPSVTKYKVNNKNYFDEPDFIPYMTEYDVPKGTEIKGVVLINPGGAFEMRSEIVEGTRVAQALSILGYQCFVVHYRVKPYTIEESAMDLARAIRYVRKNATNYGIDENKIATIGFSSGGMICGEQSLNFNGLINGTQLDSDYKPDEIDNISASANAVGLLYSYFGNLEEVIDKAEVYKNSELPPISFIYGSQDIFYAQIKSNIDALKKAGKEVDENILSGQKHAFAAGSNNSVWVNDFDKWLMKVWEN